MRWPDAVALLAIVSVLCWLVIAGLFLGFDPGDPDNIATDKEFEELIEFAPAAGPAEDGGNRPPNTVP